MGLEYLLGLIVSFLIMGYLLYASPSATFNGHDVVVAQAVVWPAVQDQVAHS